MNLKNEPVALSGGVSAAVAAVIFFLSEFNIWEPTEGQFQAIVGLLAVLIGAGTWFARSRAYGPVTIQAAMKPSPEDMNGPGIGPKAL